MIVCSLCFSGCGFPLVLSCLHSPTLWVGLLCGSRSWGSGCSVCCLVILVSFQGLSRDLIELDQKTRFFFLFIWKRYNCLHVSKLLMGWKVSWEGSPFLPEFYALYRSLIFVFFFNADILVKYLPSTAKQMNKKISILEDHDFIE